VSRYELFIITGGEMFIKKVAKILTPILLVAIGFYAAVAVAGGTPAGQGAAGDFTNLGGLVYQTHESTGYILRIMTACSYLAGFGLVIGALFKFKAHKENPAQVELGKCVVQLVVGLALIFLPSIISIGGSAIGTSTTGGTTGFTKTAEMVDATGQKFKDAE